MALSATFTANFSSFYDAVAKADAVLKDFGDGADKVGGRLNALANSFSGKKVIQDATLMAKAVEDIGGTAMLTEKEMGRLGSTVGEAVAKMKALGMDIPQNLQKIADETKGANKETVSWVGSLGQLAAAFGIAFSVKAIVDFVGSVYATASAISDLADQWGVSTTAAQQFAGAAKKSGVEVETVGKTIHFLTEQLADGSDAYKALLANVGLSYDKLRQIPLEDAYKVVLEAIAGIKDKTLQLDVAIGLLGPGVKKQIGAIRDGYVEAIEKQKVWSEDTEKRLKAAAQEWSNFKDSVVLYSGEMLMSVQEGLKRMTSSWGNFFKAIATGAANPLGGMATADMFLQMEEASNKAGMSLKDLAAKMPVVASHSTDMTAGIKTTNEVLGDQKAKSDAAAKATADAAKAELARTKALADAKKDQDEYIKRLQAEYNAVVDLKNEFSGDGLIKKANDYIEALRTSIPISEMTEKKQADINKVMEDALEVYAATGKEAPQAMYDFWAATVKADDAVVEIAGDLASLAPIVSGLPKFDMGESIKLTPPKPGTFDNLGTGIAGALSSSILKAIQGGGSILSAAGSAVGNFLLDPKQSGVGKAIEGAAQKLPGLLGGAISSAIPVVGAMIGPAISWLGDKIAGLFGKKEYEKLRDSFIQAAGGVEALTVATRAAGTNLDALFQARNTDAVKKAMEDINNSLTFQADAYQVALDTAQKYGFTIEELGPAMARQELDKQAQQLYKDWQVLNSAGLDTVTITEKMSGSVNEYIGHAMKMGTDVPMAMKPMLEAMVQSGTLLDENGNAITDLEDSGISFAMTMSDGFKALIDQVSKLTDAISRSLGVAIKEIPQPKIVGKVSWDVDQVPVAHGGSGGEAKPLESFQGGTEGFRNFGKGTPVMLHGWEAVVPKEDAGAFATVAATGGGPGAAAMPAIVINAQGAFFDTPESLQRLAGKVSDALTAKYSIMGKLRAAV